MWFKKKSVLQGEHHYDTEKSADGTTDMRTTFKRYENTSGSIASGIPSAADANKYFYLPVLGNYDNGGLLRSVGKFGCYWSSNVDPRNINPANAYCLFFNSSRFNVDIEERQFGLWVGGFE